MIELIYLISILIFIGVFGAIATESEIFRGDRCEPLIIIIASILWPIVIIISVGALIGFAVYKLIKIIGNV